MGELARYRRKTETVSAVQFNVNDTPWPHGITRNTKTGWYYADIGTPTGLRVHPGDWLVTYDDKHKTTVRIAGPLFEKMYEPLKGD